MSENILGNIVPQGIGETPTAQWDIDRLPAVEKHLPTSAKALKGDNNIPKMIEFMRGFMKQKSTRTKQQYEWDVKQFLVWCNAIGYDVLSRATTTIEVRDLASAYNEILKRHDYSRNTIALKMQGVHKFFQCVNDKELKMDMRAAFNPNNITTSDPNAFKRQPRINDEVYNEIMQYVHNNGTKSEKWIFYFLAWGCRKSEIVNAKVTDIDMLNKCIRLYMKKVGDTKTLHLPDWFTGLQEFDEGQGFIVKYDGMEGYNPESKAFKKLNKKTQERVLMNGKTPVNDQYIYDTLQRWLSQTKFKESIKSAPPHSWRRYFVNLMLRKGYAESNIAQITGHKNTVLISRYGFDSDIKNNPIIRDGAVKYDEVITEKTKEDEQTDHN